MNVKCNLIHSLSCSLQVPTLRDLLNNVKTTKWFELGLELGISSYDLGIIEKHDVEDRLRLMLQKWLEVCTEPSWRELANALRTIGEKTLATKLNPQIHH